MMLLPSIRRRCRARGRSRQDSWGRVRSRQSSKRRKLTCSTSALPPPVPRGHDAQVRERRLALHAGPRPLALALVPVRDPLQRRGQAEHTRPGHPASIPRTPSSHTTLLGSTPRQGQSTGREMRGPRRVEPTLPWMDRASITQGYAGGIRPSRPRRSAFLSVERLSDDPRAFRERCRVCAGVVEPEERPGGFGGEPFGARAAVRICPWSSVRMSELSWSLSE